MSPQPPADEELEVVLAGDELRPEYSNDGPVLRVPLPPPDPPDPLLPEPPPPELLLPEEPPLTGRWRCKPPLADCRFLLSFTTGPLPPGTPGLAI